MTTKPAAESNPTDQIDEIIEGWQRLFPQEDFEGLALAGRILVVSRMLEKRLEAELCHFGLTLGQFDILGTLRRCGPLSPKQLLENVALSSGGMTNRLDRLYELEFITRQMDDDDRRRVVITLTEKGLQAIDKAIPHRLSEANRSSPIMTSAERSTLQRVLRTWVLKLRSEMAPLRSKEHD